MLNTCLGNLPISIQQTSITTNSLCLMLFLQVNNLLSVMLGSTLFLSILLRFLLVLFAQRFVRKGRLNLNRLQQLYWFAWMVFVVNGLVPFVPVLSGADPWNTYRDQLCLDAMPDGENRKLSKFLQHALFGFKMIVLAFYVVKISHRVKTYVDGQCPRQKLSSIGKYRRNVIGLWETLFIILILHCLGFGILFFRGKYLDKSNAFLVNLVCESLMYLFYIGLFLFASRKDVPTRKEAARHVTFNNSKVKVLQPRRQSDFYFPNQAGPKFQKVPTLQPKEFTSMKILSKNSSQFNIRSPVRDAKRDWSEKAVSDNPRMTTTMYYSKAEMNMGVPDSIFQTKNKAGPKKGFKNFPQNSCRKYSSIEFELEANPDAIISFPPSPIHVRTLHNSDQVE